MACGRQAAQLEIYEEEIIEIILTADSQVEFKNF